MHSNGPDGLVSPRIPALLEWITWLEMPFTPSHVAAVLPLRGRAGLPFAALAAGSMSPDLLYYLPGFGWSPAIPTHSLLGVVTWDLAFGLLIWMAWCWAAGPLRDMSPDVLRSRWREPGSGFPGWRLAPIAVAIGSLTHVVWDSFTHAGRLGVSLVPALSRFYPSPLGPLEGHKYLQYASGVFGLIALAWVFMRTPELEPGRRRQPLLFAIAPAAILVGGLVATTLRLAWNGFGSLHSIVFVAITSFIAGTLAAAAALCLAHSVIERRRVA